MRRRLPLRIGLLYAAGDLAPTLTMLWLGFFWLYFLIDVAGLAPLEAGAVQGSGFFVSAAVTLWAGGVVDRRASAQVRGGLIAGAGAGLSVCFALLWIVPPAGWRTAWYLVWSWLFHAQFAVMYVEYLSLTRHLTAPGRERVELNSWRFAVSMTLGILLLVFHTATEGRWPLATRLFVPGVIVSIAAAAGSLVCGIGLRGMQAASSADADGAYVPWSALARSRVLWWAAGANLAVLFIVQGGIVLTIFLSAAADVNHGPVVLAVQACAVAAMVGVAARRVGADRLLLGSIVLCALGAVLWLPLTLPFAAAVCLGLGAGGATVLTWARVPDALDVYASEHGGRADARTYAGLVVLRDCTSAIVPILVTAALAGRPIGSRSSGIAAASVLLASAVFAAIAIIALGPARSPAADGGRAAMPTSRS